MYRTQVLLEDGPHKILADIARQEKRSVSDVVREMLDQQIAQRKQLELAEAAQALLQDYLRDPELTAFSTLDGEDFHA